MNNDDEEVMLTMTEDDDDNENNDDDSCFDKRSCQEIRYLRSQVTDAQTNMAVLRSELAQLRNDYEDQTVQLEK